MATAACTIADCHYRGSGCIAPVALSQSPPLYCALQTITTDVPGTAGSPVPGFKPTSAPASYEAPLSVPVFSRRREVLVGRVAMAGFYSACMWEVRATLLAAAVPVAVGV